MQKTNQLKSIERELTQCVCSMHKSIHNKKTYLENDKVTSVGKGRAIIVECKEQITTK